MPPSPLKELGPVTVHSVWAAPCPGAMVQVLPQQILGSIRLAASGAVSQGHCLGVR